MGNFICCQKSKNKRKIVLLLLGLDNAGKTVAAKGLAGEPHNGVVPTVGFSVITLKYLNYKVLIYDLGGRSDIRGIWTKYFVDAHGLIFVVDSSDYSRLSEAKIVLADLLEHDKVSGKPLLLLANKQDHELALDEVDIIEELNIESIVNANQCPTLVQTCSATDTTSNTKLDPQIKKGYDWLLSYIERNYEKLNQRVSIDVKEQEQIDKQDLEEKISRIKNMQLLEKQKNDAEEAIESYSDYARKLDQETQTNDCKSELAVEAFGVIKSDSSDRASSDSLAAVQENVHAEVSRPKSAREIVKDQLQIKEIRTRKKRSFRRTNKTSPINMFATRQIRSAGERRTGSLINRRRDFKSAENHRNFRSMGGEGEYETMTIETTDLPNVPIGPGGDDYSGQVGAPNKTFKSNISLKSSKNNVPWLHKTINGDSGISVIDVD